MSIILTPFPGVPESIILTPLDSVPGIVHPIIQGTPLWESPKIRHVRKCILFTPRPGVPRMTGIEVRGTLPSRSEYVQYVIFTPSSSIAPDTSIILTPLDSVPRIVRPIVRGTPLWKSPKIRHVRKCILFTSAPWRSPNDRHRRSGNAS